MISVRDVRKRMGASELEATLISANFLSSARRVMFLRFNVTEGYDLLGGCTDDLANALEALHSGVEGFEAITYDKEEETTGINMQGPSGEEQTLFDLYLGNRYGEIHIERKQDQYGMCGTDLLLKAYTLSLKT